MSKKNLSPICSFCQSWKTEKLKEGKNNFICHSCRKIFNPIVFGQVQKDLRLFDLDRIMG